MEGDSHLPNREPIDIIVIGSYLVEGKIFFFFLVHVKPPKIQGQGTMQAVIYESLNS